MSKRKNTGKAMAYISPLTNDARFTRELKSRMAMAKATFNRKKTLFTSKLY